MRTRLMLPVIMLLMLFTLRVRVAHPQQADESEYKLLFQSFTEPMNRVFSVDTHTWEMTTILDYEDGGVFDSLYWSGESDLFYGVLHQDFDSDQYSICAFDGAGIISKCMDVDLAEWYGIDGGPWTQTLALHVTPNVIQAIITDQRGVLEMALLDFTSGEIVERKRFRLAEGEHLDEVYWSPDGKQLLYEVSAEPFRNRIYLYDVATSTRTRVTEGDRLRCMTWSPDGQQFAMFNEELRFFDQSGEMTDHFPVTYEGEIRRGCNMAWAHHSPQIAFWDVYTEEQTVGLFVVDTETRETRILARYIYPLTEMAWSPDDQYIAAHASYWGVNEVVVINMDGWERWYRLYISPLGTPIWGVD